MNNELDLNNKQQQQQKTSNTNDQSSDKLLFQNNTNTLPNYSLNNNYFTNQNALATKFNHIALIDKQQKILSTNQQFGHNFNTTQQTINQFNHQRIPTPFNPRIPLSKSLNIHSNNRFNIIPPAPPLPVFTANFNYPRLAITQPKHSQTSFFSQPPTEQEILDKDFLNLFQNNSKSSNLDEKKKTIATPIIPVTLNHQNKLVPTIITKQKKKEKNLIDLDNEIDSKDLSVFDLFDPLAPANEQKLNKKIETDESDTDEIEKSVEQTSIPPPPPSPTPVPTVKFKLDNQTESIDLKRRDAIKYKQKKSTTNRIENFTIIDLKTINEFESFEKSINELRFQIDVEKKQLSNLIVFSPLLDCPITNRQSIKLTVKYTQTNSNRYVQETLTPSLNATVETLVYQVLTLFNVTDMNTNKYLLKIHGLEEYLPVNANLNELKYLHECIIENKEPVLILTELNTVNIELNQKTETDDNEQKNFKYIFKNDKNKNQIAKFKMETLLKTILQNKKLIEESIESNSNYSYINQLDSVLNWCMNLREKLKYLIVLVYNVHYSLLDETISKLEQIEKDLKNLQNGHGLKDRQPLMVSLVNDNDIDSSTGSTDANLNSIFSSLVDTCNKALKAILEFVNCASDSFDLNFKIIPVYDNNDGDDGDENEVTENNNSGLNLNKKEIIQSEEKLELDVNGINRLNQFLSDKSNSNLDLFLKFSIYYGKKQLDSVIIKLDKYEKLAQKKSDHFQTNQRIQFKNSDLCILPREAILLIQLCSLSTINNNLSGNQITNANSDEKIYKYHSWGSISLFKEDLTLRNGNHLICLFNCETPQLCTSASNIYSNTCPVVQIGFKNDDYIHVFPSLTNECECVLKDFETLPVEIKENVLKICNKSVIADTLNEDEKDLVHSFYLYLNGIPNALNKIYLSFSPFDYSSLINFYAYLKQCDSLTLTESLELLLPNFPDVYLRNHAVNSLKNFSPEMVSLYLPQLLEALRYENNHNSELVHMLLSFASKNIRFAHKLYWQISEFNSRKEDFLQIRYELLYQALLHFFSTTMKNEIDQEKFLLKKIHDIGTEVKINKDNDKLFGALEELSHEWANAYKDRSCRLPYNISYCTREVDIKACSYISSFTMPLKLVFKNVDSSANSFYTIYKIGDDLRQDMFVLQMINVMNQLWIMEDHDLSVLTFTCLQTGDRCGFIEMVTNAETLKEIQKGEVMKAFKKSYINDWLRTHNPNQNNFKKAVTNFTKSCAAYSVATYILGIGDRHNDNIMVKYTGHMFHIDFGKYLGDAQTFAGFKRDRTPILFTPDMFYVINQGKEANTRFQEFIETCCRAFQILRKNYHHLLSLIELMSSSGIPGLNRNAIQYVYKNLMIDLNEDASSNAFKKLIYESISRFASFNFAIHTLAQPKTVNASNYFSFVTHTFNAETDGKIISINLIEKTNQGSVELFKCVVNRETEYDTNEVYRTFEEFCELYQLLSKTFTTLKMPDTVPLNKFKETKQSNKRYQLVDSLLRDIISMQAEISQSDIIYTFFHSILRDQKEVVNDTEMLDLSKDEIDSEESKTLNDNQDEFFHDIKGQIKVKLKYKDNKFYVNCLQCRNLKPPNNQQVAALKPYVKCYLRPDYTKATKKKVQALFNGANPIFTETMEYDISLIDLKKRTLEISVINNKLNNKEKIGSVEIRLYDIEWNNNEYIKWYDLSR